MVSGHVPTPSWFPCLLSALLLIRRLICRSFVLKATWACHMQRLPRVLMHPLRNQLSSEMLAVRACLLSFDRPIGSVQRPEKIALCPCKNMAGLTGHGPRCRRLEVQCPGLNERLNTSLTRAKTRRSVTCGFEYHIKALEATGLDFVMRKVLWGYVDRILKDHIIIDSHQPQRNNPSRLLELCQGTLVYLLSAYSSRGSTKERKSAFRSDRTIGKAGTKPPTTHLLGQRGIQ